jgi:hypothetical protein
VVNSITFKLLIGPQLHRDIKLTNIFIGAIVELRIFVYPTFF